MKLSNLLKGYGGHVKEFLEDLRLPGIRVNPSPKIVDVNRFTQNVIAASRRCTSYDSADPKHQHVVVCVKPILNFEKLHSDTNFTVESVAMGFLRPAVNGVIKVASSGQAIAYLAAVHLKAEPDSASTRKSQIANLAAHIKNNVDAEMPIVILGDFNTLDVEPLEFQGLFDDAKLDIAEVPNENEFTFNDVRRHKKFDRVWVSNSIDVVQQPAVLGPCNNDSNESADVIRKYNKTVSDHCAVKVSLNVDSQPN